MKLLTGGFGNPQVSSKTCFHIFVLIGLICALLPFGWSSEETEKTTDDILLENLALFSEILA